MPPPFPSAPPYASTAKAITSSSTNTPSSSAPPSPPFPSSAAAPRASDADVGPSASGGGLLFELQGVRARLKPAKTKLSETCPAHVYGGVGRGASKSSMGNSRKKKSADKAAGADGGGTGGKSPRPHGDEKGSLGAIFATAMMRLANVHGHGDPTNEDDGGFSSEDESEPALV